MDFTHSAHYHYVDVALAERTSALLELEKQMAAFKARPASDFTAYAADLREHTKKLNPSMSDDSLDQFVKSYVDMESSERVQFLDAFNNRLMGEGVMITLLSNALCEAAINAILAIGLAHYKKESLFDKLEKMDMKEKWTDGPQHFCPTYNLPKSGQLYGTLRALNKRRNALVHYKITIESGGKVVLGGTKIPRATLQSEVKLLKRFARLPYELHKHACSQVRGPSLVGVLSRTWRLAKF